MRLNRRLGAGSLVALAIGLVAATGCSGKKQTEMVPGFSTQVKVPRDMKSIRVDVRLAGVRQFCRAYQVYDGKVRLPRTLGMLPSESPKRPFTVEIAGFQTNFDDGSSGVSSCENLKVSRGAADARIIRRSTQAYVEDAIKFLPMPMRYSCYDVDCPNDTETCKAGKCTNATIDETKLADYRDDLIFGKANTCFSAALCMPQPLTFAPQVVDKDKCVFAMPFTPSADDRGVPKPSGFPGPEVLGTGVNVKVQWDGGYVNEVLDLDADEGFTIPDPTKPQRIQLAPNLCDVYKNGNAGGHYITAIEMSGRCPSKTPLQPMCEAEVPGSETSDAGAELFGQGGCNSLPALKPAPSALLVLIDQTKNMQNAFFTDNPQSGGNVISALDNALQDPALAETRAAMEFFPTSALAGGDCTVNPSPFASQAPPGDVPFAKALEAKNDILNKIRDRTKNGGAALLPQDTTLHLGAALRADGAYKALADLGPASSFNERILLIIGNRQFDQDGCGGDLVAKASAAFQPAQSRIRTYVVLRDTAKTDVNAIGAAFNITNAGGGTNGNQVFDSRPDEESALNAITRVVAQLGSCLYAAPGQIIPTSASLSYYDALKQSQVKIASTAGACDENTLPNAAGGWKQEPNGRVRICGQACTDLRKTLEEQSKFNLVLKQAAPAMPIHPVVCTGP
jgi:hypothetical protein